MIRSLLQFSDGTFKNFGANAAMRLLRNFNKHFFHSVNTHISQSESVAKPWNRGDQHGWHETQTRREHTQETFHISQAFMKTSNEAAHVPVEALPFTCVHYQPG